MRAAACLALAAACGRTPAGAPDVAPTPVPPSSAPSGSVVTGFVFENTGRERRALAGARVIAVDLLDGPYGDFAWYETRTDAAGRFTIASFENRRIKITAYSSGTPGPLWSQSLYQVCGVHPLVNGHTSTDVELLRAGIEPAVWTSPTLSGVVYEHTPEGLRPAPQMAVLYSSYSHDGADVYTRTDDAGRYRFCDVPPGSGYVLPACSRAESPPEHPVNIFSVRIAGDTVFNPECR
jgi:hypothetical protein